MPNPFRKNICSVCQSKIQDHASASDKEVASAIEYIAESIPSLILQQENGPDIFMGGFKSALNLEFLKSNKIGLIICAAKNLAQTFGPSYQRKVQKRDETLPHIQVVELPWVDNMQQILEQCELKNILRFLLLKFNFFNGIFYGDSIFFNGIFWKRNQDMTPAILFHIPILGKTILLLQFIFFLSEN